MTVLVSNDDGFFSEGIQKLATALREVADERVVIVAPDRDQSTTSHSLTINRPLRVRQKDDDTFAVDGTPTDCVYMAVSGILNEKPSFIFSGINKGANLGDDVHYSGTVAAAVEGGLIGVPAVAFSQVGRDDFNYDTAAEFAKKMYRHVKKHPLPESIILNVNVPEGAKSLDYRLAETGRIHYGKTTAERIDPRGRPYYWIGGDCYEFEALPNSDTLAIRDGLISVTPLNVKLTDQSYLDHLKEIGLD